MRRKLAAGNWKMNGTGPALAEVEALIQAHPHPSCDILICPPSTLIHRAAQAARSSVVAIGGQDCHPASNGAHTGDVSAAMLAEAGATHVITGHSERREDHGETDSLVRAKTEAAISSGLHAILCIGESLAEREAGRTLDVLAAQLAGSLPDSADGTTLTVAYEPIWAIGTGKVPSLAEIGEVHAFLREELGKRYGAGTADDMRLLYGGSVKPDNAGDIFGVADVDGALVGGASLKASDFAAIIKALEQA